MSNIRLPIQRKKSSHSSGLLFNFCNKSYLRLTANHSDNARLTWCILELCKSWTTCFFLLTGIISRCLIVKFEKPKNKLLKQIISLLEAGFSNLSDGSYQMTSWSKKEMAAAEEALQFCKIIISVMYLFCRPNLTKKYKHNTHNFFK